MMQSYLEEIRKHIEKITGRSCRVTATGELECVCPKCGGSKSNKNKKQFYISLKDPSHPFICFRCGFKGKIINLIDFLLKEYSIKIPFSYSNQTPVTDEEDDLGISLKNFYIINSVRRKQLEKYYEEKDLDKVFCENCRPFLYKRIFGKEEGLAKKILKDNGILDDFEKNIVSTFICCRSVKTLTNNKYSNFLGISSSSGNVLQIRNINKDSNIRYISLKLVDLNWDPFPVFNIGNSFENKSVIIAEGIFTLLRGFLFLINKGFFDRNNFLLYATFGKQNLNKEIKKIVKYRGNNFVMLLDQDFYVKDLVSSSNIKFLKPIEKYKDFGEIEITNSKTCFIEVGKNEFEKSFNRTYGGVF